jgi:hypothetical protein
MINPDAKTGGKSSRRRASKPESGMLSQSTRMPRPAASPPDAGHPSQSQVCSVNQPGCQDRPQVLQTPGIQPRVRYAQSISLDVKIGSRSSRCRAPTQSQVCSVNQPGCQDRWQVLQTPGVQTRVRYAKSIIPNVNIRSRSSRCRASNSESGMLSQSTWMSISAAGPPDAGHLSQRQVFPVNHP